MANKRKVVVSCGTVNPEYRGVAQPELTAVFLQTEAERKKYEPIMKHFQENGLDAAGTTISGI